MLQLEMHNILLITESCFANIILYTFSFILFSCTFPLNSTFDTGQLAIWCIYVQIISFCTIVFRICILIIHDNDCYRSVSGFGTTVKKSCYESCSKDFPDSNDLVFGRTVIDTSGLIHSCQKCRYLS